jgi:hypothetical protein
MAPRVLFTAAVVLLWLLNALFLVPVRAPADPGPEKVRVAVSKDAYWYRPGGTAQMRITIDNITRQPMKDVSVRVRIHAPNATRSDLDACFEGKLRKVYRQTETFDDLTLSTGNNRFTFEVELKASRYSSGVYPVTVEVVQDDDVLSASNTQLIIMSEEEPGEPVPLKLTWIFDTLEPPHRGPDGFFTSDELAAECSSSSGDPGWYPTLLEALEKWQGLKLNLNLSPMLLEDMQALTGDYVVRKGDREKEVGAGSRQSSDAAKVLEGFRGLARSSRHQLIPGPYASPDLARLVSLGWRGDAVEQLTSGRELLEETLGEALSADFSCPPGQRISTGAITALGENLGRYLVIDPGLLETTREGRRLLRGLTLSSPIAVKGAGKSDDGFAVVSDERVGRLLKRLSQSGDPHGVAQCVLSELTNLYLERPTKIRTCVVLAPGSWHPAQDVLQEVLRSLDGAPWLETATLAESFSAVEPLDNEPLVIPSPDKDGPEADYFAEVGEARRMYDDFVKATLRGNPLLSTLERDIYYSESDAWRQLDQGDEGLAYSAFVTQTIENELAKVEMPAMGSITLTSTRAEVPLSVLNSTGYRMKAELVLASNGLAFPEGRRVKVLLEPKENLFEIPVTVLEKGRLRFAARLEVDDLVLGELEFTVLTSRFNTFAIALVGGLLALIGVFWVVKLLARRKVGKHKRRQLRETEKARA